MPGVRSSDAKPKPPSATNHNTITGPNSWPILWVPRLWIRNRLVRMTSDSGTTRLAKCGFSTFRPSTAAITVTAGVSMPSPKNSASPTMAPMPMVALTLRVMLGERCARAASASVPPSP